MSASSQPSQIPARPQPEQLRRRLASRVVRNCCTSKHGPFQVGEMSVIRIGGLVALHLCTPAGTFAFHVCERTFVRASRAATDDQGHAWRTIAELDAARLEIAATVEGSR